jgi:hypothetical protein
MTTKRIGAILLPASCCLLFAVAASAEDKPPERFIYSTYHYCDFSKQDRADELYMQSQKPDMDAAIKDGTISAYGWMAHNTGGKWRRVDYFVDDSVQGLLDAQKKFAEQSDSNKTSQKAFQEFASICNSHDDYIWHAVAGNIGTVARGGASFSTYYVCDQGREDQADDLVKNSLAPIFDKMVADGKLKSWGWNEHIVGGEYRRLETLSADDVKTLMEARGALVEALQNNPAGDLLTEICPSHADYIWEIKAQAP